MENKGKFTINEYLKSARVLKQLSQIEVAKRLGYKNGQFVSNWERGLSLPPKKVIKDLCKIYGIEKQQMINFYVKAKIQELESPTL